MAICSFCGEDKKPTKEHVWSNVVLRIFDDVAPITFDEKHSVAHGGDSVLKDLCEDCNRGMSPVDTAMGKFAKEYLKGNLTDHQTIEFDDPDILRWVMKTASNHERWLGLTSTWWHNYVGFFHGAATDTSNVDLLLAPWLDLSPEEVATKALGVLTLGAHGLMLAGLRQCDPKSAHAQIESSWALKVGSGVFAIIVWKANTPAEIRDSVISELRGYGWLLFGRDNVVGQVPFNSLTCTLYYIPFDPGRIDLLDVLQSQ